VSRARRRATHQREPASSSVTSTTGTMSHHIVVELTTQSVHTPASAASGAHRTAQPR
jgi:hypothetical protein